MSFHIGLNQNTKDIDKHFLNGKSNFYILTTVPFLMTMCYLYILSICNAAFFVNIGFLFVNIGFSTVNFGILIVNIGFSTVNFGFLE